MNIYLKTIQSEDDLELAKRTLRYLIKHVNQIENLTSISNILRTTDILDIDEYEPLFQRGLEIIKYSRDEENM